MSTHVGPIIFADEIARGQLESDAEVVTFRASERTTGDTWWRTSRLGPKEGDCTVEHIGPVDPSDGSALAPYRDLSGFQSVAAWQEAIRELNGGLEGGHLYRVTLEGGETA